METGVSCPQWLPGGCGVFFARQGAPHARLDDRSEREVFTFAEEGMENFLQRPGDKP